jgi:Flp pilus assembly protein TadG
MSFQPLRRMRSNLRSEDGQAFVEFALITPILLTIIFAGIGFGQLFFTYQQLSAATSEGARRGIVSRTASSPSQAVIDATRSAAPNLDPGNINVSVSSSWQPGANLTVTATYPAEVTVLGLTLYDSNLSSTRTMRVEQ